MSIIIIGYISIYHLYQHFTYSLLHSNRFNNCILNTYSSSVKGQDFYNMLLPFFSVAGKYADIKGITGGTWEAEGLFGILCLFCVCNGGLGKSDF